jgi:hypothetical protein
MKDSVGSDVSQMPRGDDMPSLSGMDSRNDQNQDQFVAINPQLQHESAKVDLSQLAKPKVNRGVGRPRKQIGLPIDPSEISDLCAAATAEPEHSKLPERQATAHQLNASTRFSVPSAEMMTIEAECQRAIAAGLEYQSRQAAHVFLGALVANASSLDETTAAAVLKWARMVHKRLSQVDPVSAFLQEIRAGVAEK